MRYKEKFNYKVFKYKGLWGGLNLLVKNKFFGENFYFKAHILMFKI